MVVSCVGWAVWDAFRNITALVFLEDWQLKFKTYAQHLRDESEHCVFYSKPSGHTVRCMPYVLYGT